MLKLANHNFLNLLSAFQYLAILFLENCGWNNDASLEVKKEKKKKRVSSIVYCISLKKLHYIQTQVIILATATADLLWYPKYHQILLRGLQYS